MDLTSKIYSKTGKGTRALSTKPKGLPPGALKVLPLIDSKTNAAAILAKLDKFSETDLLLILARLERDGYIRAIHEENWSLDEQNVDYLTAMVVEELSAADFFRTDEKQTAEIDIAEAQAHEEAERKAQEQQTRLKAEAERIKRDNAEREARAKEEARRKAEESARVEAERQTQEARRRAEAEMAAHLETERTAREVAEKQARAAEQARLKAEAETRSLVEKAALMEAERLVREAAERKAREEAETLRQTEAEKTARLETERVAREAAERQAREAEKVRLKAEADARAKAERSAQLEAEHIAREVAERQVREAEEARLKAEAEARALTEQAARLEAEKLAREEAERQARKEEEARRVAEAERMAREEAERQVRMEQESRLKAEADARAEAESNARLEAERFAREAAERQARAAEEARRKAEAERKAQEDAERRERKAEEARIKAEADASRRRAKEEVRAQAAEKTRQKSERKAQEQADRRARKLAEAIAKKRKTPDSGKRFAAVVKTVSVYLPTALILIVVALHFVNLAPLAGGSIQQIAAESLGEPVRFDDMRASLLPKPQLILSDVVIGPDADMNIASIRVALTPSSLFDDQKSVDSLEIADVSLAMHELDRIQRWFRSSAKSGKLHIARVSFKNVTLTIPGLAPIPFDGRIDLLPTGEFGDAALTTVDRSLSLHLQPENDAWKVTLDASNWQPPLSTWLKFDELHAEGYAEGRKARFDKIEGRVYGGTLTAKGTITWAGRPTASGSFNIENIELAQALTAAGSAASVEGRFDAAASFTSISDNAGKLIEAAEISARFSATDGKIGGVDLSSAMLPTNREKSTHFDKLTGSLQFGNGIYRYRNLALAHQQFRAQGNLDIQDDQRIAGSVSAQLNIPSRRMQANFGLGGTVGDIRIR